MSENTITGIFISVMLVLALLSFGYAFMFGNPSPESESIIEAYF